MLQVDAFLNALPTMFKRSVDVEAALGPALEAAALLMQPVGKTQTDNMLVVPAGGFLLLISYFDGFRHACLTRWQVPRVCIELALSGLRRAQESREPAFVGH
jgi:hypothetical protein